MSAAWSQRNNLMSLRVFVLALAVGGEAGSGLLLSL